MATERLELATTILRNAHAAVERVHAVVEHMTRQLGDGLAAKATLGRRILIVDDEMPLLAVLRRTLRGYDIEAVSSPRAALARIVAGERFAFILSDLMMTEMSGADLYQEIERVDAEQAARFVFMTAGALTPEAGSALTATGRPFLRKPFGAKVVWQLFAGLKPVTA